MTSFLFDFIPLLKPPIQANGCNIVGFHMLHLFAHPVACCCVLLGVAAQKFETSQTFKPTTLQHPCLLRDLLSISQQCWIHLHSFSNIVGECTCIACGLQSLMGCILPMMHCRSQHCWQLLHPFAFK